MAAQLHFTEDAFTLHLFLESLESLIDVVIANENLQAWTLEERDATTIALVEEL